MNQSRSDNDLTSAPSRRAFKEAHGRWPNAADLSATRYTVTFTRAPVARIRTAPPPPGAHACAAPAPYKSPKAVPANERTAWETAYSQPGELGPVGGTWPNDGRHVPYMVWRLGVNQSR